MTRCVRVCAVSGRWYGKRKWLDVDCSTKRAASGYLLVCRRVQNNKCHSSWRGDWPSTVAYYLRHPKDKKELGW